MSSIDATAILRAAGPLFDALAAAGTPAPFPMAPDPALGSYYVARAQPSMQPADFERASCLDLAEFEQRLAAHWVAAGRPALAAQAAAVAAAAHVLRDLYAQAQPQPEVSPYIYAMF